MENNSVMPLSIPVQHVYAYILNETVMNVVVCDNYQLANDVAKGSYGNDAFAVECAQWACSIGDKYINGVFYEPDGVTPIQYIPSDRDVAEEGKQQAAYAHERIDEILEILNTANIPLVFKEMAGNCNYYRSIYFKNNMDMNLVPDLGNLREVVDPEWVPPNK